MQHIKANKHLLFIATPIISIIGLLLFWHQLNHVATALSAAWIITTIAAILIITPFGNKRLCLNHDDVAKRIPTLKWLLKITILQISLLGAYAGMCLINGTLFPIMTEQHNHLFIHSISASAIIGIFPWPVYTLIAVSMGIIAYRKQQNAFFSTLINPLSNPDPKSIIGTLANVGARRSTLFAVSTCIIFMTMLLLNLLLSANIHLAYGFKPAALYTTLVILVLSLSDRVKKYLTRFFTKKSPIAWGILTFCLLFGFSIFLINIMLSGMVAQQVHTSIQVPKVIERLINKDWMTCWLIFSFTWAATLTPAVASYIANISKGYRIRDVVIAILALPTLTTSGIYYFHDTIAAWPSLPPTYEIIITLLSFWVFLSVILSKETLPNLILSYFPNDGIIKHRDNHPFFQKIFSLTAACFYVYFAVGITGLSLMYFTFTYLFAISFFLTAIALIKYLVTDK